MKWLLGILFCTAAFAADPTDPGDPILPADAVHILLHSQSSPADLKNEMEKIAGIRWAEPAVDFLADVEEVADEVAPSWLSASLLKAPETLSLIKDHPFRNCMDVTTERRQVHAWIRQVDELSGEINARLAYFDRACQGKPRCDTRSVNPLLDHMNSLISKLGAYADSEAEAVPDRLIKYTFHLDQKEGLDLLQAGWRPIGASELIRVRYYLSPWDAGPDFGFGEEGKLSAPPQAAPDGAWIVTRPLTATHACVNGQIFHLDFLANFGRPGSEPAANENEQERIHAISL
jgi:hypothetical protein